MITLSAMDSLPLRCAPAGNDSKVEALPFTRAPQATKSAPNEPTEIPMPSKLDQLRAMTVVVADTGDLDAVRRLKPQDCTTNPTLLLKAVESPAHASLVEETLRWAERQGGVREAVVAAACDRLCVAFGAELSRIVPGRVSTEVDADLSFDTQGSIARARDIIAAYAERGIGRERVLIKIASTWEGICAAKVLQREGID